MSLYNEQTQVISKTLKTFDRAYLVTVDNPRGFSPRITYSEERVRLDENNNAENLGRVGSVSKELTPDNAMTEFDLMNPIDGTPLGSTATYQDVQVLLHSLYFHLATERDAS